MNATTTTNTDNQSSGYFDLHTSGLGYLNRVRTVQVKKGEGFLACSISALRGSADAAEYTTFDVRVSGSQAKEAIKMLEADVNAKKAVIIGFKLGDTYPEVFTYEKDMGKHKKGDLGVMTKGRLLKVSFAKVDGAVVELPSTQADAQAEAQPEQEPATGTNG